MTTFYLKKHNKHFSLEDWWGFVPKVKDREEGLALAKQLISRCGTCQMCPGPLIFDPGIFSMLISRDGTPVPAKICPNLNDDTTVETV